MKIIKYLPYIILGVVLLYGFKSDTARDQFQKMKTLTQIIRLVSENYVEDVDMNEILEGAIIGLLDKLDPHSNYISSEQSELISQQFDGEFEGIGIEFTILEGYITVISPIPGTPSDRAGLVGPDGPTHHGVFDIPMLRMLPNMVVTSPKDGNELRNLLATATTSKKSFSIRYPKGSSRKFDKKQPPEILKIGEWEKLSKGSNVAILATGSMVGVVEDNLDIINGALGFIPTLINARFIKPMDKSMLISLSEKYDAILTMEEGCLAGGFGSAVIEYYTDMGNQIKVTRMGIPDYFVEHGTRGELLDSLDFNGMGIVNKIKAILEELNE